MTAKTKELPGVEEVWTYIGRREITKGLAYFWLDADGERQGFKKGRNLAVGGRYKQRVNRDPDGENVQVFTAHQALESYPDKEDPRVAQWTVEDRAAYAADEARKLENRAARDRSAWEGLTLSELREHFQRLPHGQRAALAAWLTAYLWGTK